MGKGYRQGRLGEEIRKIVSQMLLTELKDPRLQEEVISVSAVEVTRDGSYATVYISILNFSQSKEQETNMEAGENIIAAFQNAKGLIKREIGKQVKLRHVPELIFKMDNSMDYGRHITEILSGLDIKETASTEGFEADSDDDFEDALEEDFEDDHEEE